MQNLVALSAEPTEYPSPNCPLLWLLTMQNSLSGASVRFVHAVLL